MSDRNNEKKKKKSPKILLFIVLIYFLASSLPAIFGVMRSNITQTINIPGNNTPYKNLELLDARAFNLSDTEEWKSGELKKTVPELQNMELQSDCQVFRFEVHVKNTGTRDARYDGSVYLGNGDGFTWQAEEKRDDSGETKDTRIIPSGREATVTIYGQVSNDSSNVLLKTYDTKDYKPESIEVQLYGQEEGEEE